jgi:hypothetical protein
MTFKELEDIMIKNNIPKNVKLMSDSGWECCATDMNGVFYRKKKNEIVFTQEPRHYSAGYICLNIKPPSDDQIKFATAIAETLGLNLPKEENYYEYQDFIWKNERDYRFVKKKSY